MTYGGGPSGGYIIDYATSPRAVSRWSLRLGQDAIITPLPYGVRLLYSERPEDEPQDHVREFTVEEIESMDLHVLNYMYAADLYAEIWEDLPEETHGETPPDSPNVPNGIGIGSYD